MLIQLIATYVHKGRKNEADAVGALADTRWRFTNSRRPTATSLKVVLGVSAAGLLAPLSRGPA
jgi:hypothetical protein